MSLPIRVYSHGFVGILDTRYVDGRRWLVANKPDTPDTFAYITSNGYRIEPSDGYITDFATIPRPFWSIIGGPLGKYTRASVIHDFLCDSHLVTREQADRIFLEAMKTDGVGLCLRWTMFLAVRSYAVIAGKR